MSDAPTKKVEVIRKGSAVVLVINCTDDYAAMILYDEIAAELANGYLELELETAVKREATKDGDT